MTASFTIDLEHWYCSTNVEHALPRSEWHRLPSRLAGPTEALLDMLERHGIRATFFVLGHTAEREPTLVRNIVHRGHDVGCHSYSHELVHRLTPTQFMLDTRKALEAIRNCTGCQVDGYRAPSFSMTLGMEWAADILVELGFTYDSSIVPTTLHPTYGDATAPLRPFLWKNGLREYPLTCARVAGRNLPCAGGAWFRLLPQSITQLLVGRAISHRIPLVFYAHPWEWDTGVPHIPGRWWKDALHRYGSGGMMRKIEKILEQHEWTLLRDVPVTI